MRNTTQNTKQEELSLSEARKLAEYYGGSLRKENEVRYSKIELQSLRESLSYCRCIILRKSRKIAKSES
jgi:hypothetical protein